MLRLIPASYEEEHEAARLYRSLAPEAEVVLFTGPVPYHVVASQEDVTLPMHYMPLRGTALYPALYWLRTSRLSVDTLPLRDVEGVCHELGLDADQLVLLEGTATRRDMVAFHEESYRAGRSAGAITGLRTACQELERRGVPAYWARPTRVDLIDALERVRGLGESARHDANQAVVGLIGLADGLPAAEVERQSLAIQACLLRFAEECHGYIVPLSERQWHLFATRGPLEQATGGLTSLRPLEEIRLATGLAASLGLGFGLTASIAGAHARAAFDQARRHGGGCYAMTADRRLMGPLGQATESKAVRPPESGLAALADTTGIAAKPLRRLVSHLTRFQTFTAHEIAPVLGLSLRSAHRILARMEQAGVVEVVGQERLRTPGRPRQVYKLTERTLALSVV